MSLGKNVFCKILWGRRGGDFVPPPSFRGGAVQWFPARSPSPRPLPCPPVPSPAPPKKGEIGGEKRGEEGEGEEGGGELWLNSVG